MKRWVWLNWVWLKWVVGLSSLVLLGFVGYRKSSVFGFDIAGFGSGVAGFLLVICGFCFGSDGWWVMSSEALLV